jgi:hypothetical protein
MLQLPFAFLFIETRRQRYEKSKIVFTFATYWNMNIKQIQSDMKLKTILWILSALFFALGWMSCTKATGNALSLHQIENNAIHLYYGSTSGVTIIGGDGHYAFSCESPLLKVEMTHRNYISLEPLGVGEATVTISDSAGESYTLHVTITCKTLSVVIAKLDVTVAGDAMTVAEQEELKAKALATVPVRAGGGYRFIYTEGDEQDRTEGTVLIYPETYEQGGMAGSFTQETVRKDDGGVSGIFCTLRYSGMERRFIFMMYNESPVKSLPPKERVFYRFVEDLTERYKTDCPNVEQVYTSQVIDRMTVE